LASAALALCAIAAAEELHVPIRLDDTVVTATRSRTALGDVPAAISVVDQDAIQEARPTTSFAEPLDRVPGVFVQDAANYAQDARIQIRGFGTRAAFGVREIRVLVDGLPLTLPDGQTQLDDVDLGAIARIEVLRGPSSSLYGNAAGGVMQLFTEDAPAEPEIALRATGGSFGLAKVQVKGGGRTAGARLFVQGSFFRTGGYREQSAAESGIVNAKLQWDVDPATEVTFLLAAVDAPLAEDPGGLTAEQVRANPRQARALNAELDAGEAVEQARVGAVASHRSGPNALSAYVYLLYRDFDSSQPIPPEAGDGIVAFHRTSPGGGVRWVNDARPWGIGQTLTLGLDAQGQDDGRQRWANDGGRRGALGVSEDESVTGVGAYVREAVEVVEHVEVSGGVRFDDVTFANDVAFPTDSPDSGRRSFSAWSPAGGVLWRPWAWLSAYANTGTAFQVPTTTELANPDGPGFNPAIGPQRAVSWELGGRAELDRRAALGLDGEAGLAAYWIDVEDELIPFESPSGRVAFRNAGRSRRLGLEIDWQSRLDLATLAGDAPLARGTRLDWTGALTLIDARYQSYTTQAGDFSGNREPGIPPWQVYQQIALRHPGGLFVALEAFFVGSYFVDDANDARATGYPLLGLRAAWPRRVGPVVIEPFFGIQNLADASYAGTVRLNALGGRFFEPAPGINFYGGIALSARL
jgi:iron complex outermembrane recepter protein